MSSQPAFEEALQAEVNRLMKARRQSEKVTVAAAEQMRTLEEGSPEHTAQKTTRSQSIDRYMEIQEDLAALDSVSRYYGIKF